MNALSRQISNRIQSKFIDGTPNEEPVRSDLPFFAIENLIIEFSFRVRKTRNVRKMTA